MKSGIFTTRPENWDYACWGEGKHTTITNCPGSLFALHAEQSVALVLLVGLPLQSVDSEELVPIWALVDVDTANFLRPAMK